MNSFISTAKANRLFWLARYVERVFISLNAIRKYIDTDIDGATNAYREEEGRSERRNASGSRKQATIRGYPNGAT